MQNLYPLFKFIEDKKGIKVPLMIKFIYVPETLTKEDLDVRGDLDIACTSIISLPDNLKVGGSLDLVNKVFYKFFKGLILHFIYFY